MTFDCLIIVDACAIPLPKVREAFQAQFPVAACVLYCDSRDKALVPADLARH